MGTGSPGASSIGAQGPGARSPGAMGRPTRQPGQTLEDVLIKLITNTIKPESQGVTLQNVFAGNNSVDWMWMTNHACIKD